MSVIYGSVKPFEQILRAAQEIMDGYEYAAADDYEPWDDCDGRDLAPELYRWAKSVAEQAEDYIRMNSSNAPINGGENW